MARDCLAACVAGMPPGRVFVVTADPSVAAMAADVGAVRVADPRDGLNPAVMAGITAARESAARDSPIAALLGDLPALRPGDLMAALRVAAAWPLAFVPDADGTGTVLITATDGSVMAPRFGERSAQQHEAAGHRRLDLDLPRLRTDVDDDASLRAAITLGVGSSTTQALLGEGVTLPLMQASVHTFDDETGAGSALLDDGREVHFSAEVFAASALRHVRPGQRVSIELDRESMTVQRLWIVGIGDDQRIG
jgi:2-phospho-L-lactate guanylyltransferase